MSIKRTREQKELAMAKRMEPNMTGGSISLRLNETKGNFVSRELTLPVDVIKKDLIKTTIVTLVAIGAQAILVMLISKGVVRIPGV